MSEQEDKGLVPVLRFPEFRVVGAWTKYQLGQCLSRHPNYGINAPAVPYSDNLPRYLRITDISDDGEIRQDQKASVAKGVADENYLDEGDVVLARTGASVGKAYKYRLKDGKLVFAGFLIRVKPDARKLNSELFFQFLFTEQYWHWVNLTSARSGQPGINGNEYSLLPIPLPPTLNEQHKIADCLTSIDELITAQTQKLDALKNHKKGLMQQLFPAEGETTPKLRFPEFRDKGEWEERKLGDISDIKTGPFGSVLHESDYVEIGTPIITVEHLGEIGIKGDRAPKVSDTDKQRLASYILNNGDIVFSRVGSVDRCAIVGTDEEGWLFSGRLLRLRITSVVHSSNFLNHLLKYEPSKEKIRNNAVGQTMPSLNTEILRSISLFMPFFDEQQKIADCLASVDDLITAQIQKLDALKTHKKGLMQQLFPAIDDDCMDAEAEIDRV